jgi:hypothetical protein
MLHEWHPVMFARIAFLALVLGAAGCSKPQTPVQLHESVGTPAAVVEPTPAPVDIPSAPTSEPDPTEFAHVVVEQGTAYVVLSAEPDEAHWAKGAPRLVANASPVVIQRDVDRAALPKSMTRHLGRGMRLAGPSGEVCRGTLGAPTILGRVEPHFGERQRWGGEEIDGVMTPPWSEERIAEEAWSMSAGGQVLVAELVDASGDCRDALFARALDLPVLATSAARRPSATLSARAKAELRKLPAYGALEEAYRKSTVATPSLRWTETEDAIVDVHEFSTDMATFVWLSASGGQPCSDFSGRIDVLWKVIGTNAKDLRFEVLYAGEAEFSPEMLLQQPGEKNPSFVGRESILRKGPDGYAVDSLHVPFLDCPC